MSAGRWLIPLVAVTFAAVGGCRPAEQPLASGPQAPSIAHRIWVLGGDILVVDNQHIRLSNAFAPETVPEARCWAEALAAQFATRRVKEMVRNAGAIEVRPTGGRDEYNRIYAEVMLDGLNLGDWLHHEGLAARSAEGRRFEWCNPISMDGEGAPDWRAFGEPGRP